MLVLVLTSLPGSFVLVSPSSAAFGFGLGSLALEMLTRRVRQLCVWMALRPALQLCGGVGSWMRGSRCKLPWRPHLLWLASRFGAPHPASLAAAQQPLPGPPSPALQLRLHLQLLSSLVVYVVGLSLMGLHDDGSPARGLISRESLATSCRCHHQCSTALPPALHSAACLRCSCCRPAHSAPVDLPQPASADAARRHPASLCSPLPIAAPGSHLPGPRLPISSV